MLYHRVPPVMEGKRLLPLTLLKEAFPALFEANLKKYDGRLDALAQYIPPLHCYWPDVVFLTPVHPIAIRRSLVNAGLSPRPREYFAIKPSALSPARTTIWLGNNPSDPADYRQYSAGMVYFFSPMPLTTEDRYKAVVAGGGRPFIFAGLPHVLHRGGIDLTDVEIITA